MDLRPFYIHMTIFSCLAVCKGVSNEQQYYGFVKVIIYRVLLAGDFGS